jgi:hypothetical protein
MSENQITVADVFRRAQAIRQANPNGAYKEISAQLAKEFAGKPFPSPTRLTIPEQDALVPEEDWTAGLPIILRGIQTENWKEISHGIIICLEQIENFQRESGAEQSKAWHDRSRGIDEQTKKGLGKWLPEDLMKAAERSAKR